jgi:3-hydroxypropanoate dehydrogenase
MTNVDINKIFEVERTCYNFSDKKVDLSLIRSIYDLMKMGPTSANCCPLRIVFVTTDEKKDALSDCVMPGNIKHVKSAPITAIFAYDTKFYEKMTKLYSHNPAMKEMFENNSAMSNDTAMRNSALQAAYFMVLARAHGLAITPMSGFAPDSVNETFFAGTSHKVNFICAIGYRGAEETNPRLPRLDFDEACRVI